MSHFNHLRNEVVFKGLSTDGVFNFGPNARGQPAHADDHESDTRQPQRRPGSEQAHEPESDDERDPATDDPRNEPFHVRTLDTRDNKNR